MKIFITGTGLVLILLCVGCTAFPDGFLLDIIPACSQNVSTPATITATTDYSITVDLECKNGYLLTVDSTDGGTTYIGNVNYSGDPSTECVFEKHPITDVYKVMVLIYYGTLGSTIHSSTDQYLITCTYNDRTETNTSTSDISESFLSPEEVHGHGGTTASSSFSLDVKNVVGTTLTTNIPLGKKIKLVAEMQDTVPSEVSAQAVSCSAIAGSYKYSVLRGGCGDGVIFNRYSGFTTSGRIITSPYFSAFHLKKSNTIQFECNFTVCAAACDGSSCGDSAPSRRRRSAEYDLTATEPPSSMGENFVSVLSSFFILDDAEDEKKQKHTAIITKIQNDNQKNKDLPNEDLGKDSDDDDDDDDDGSEIKVTSSVTHLGTTKISNDQLRRRQKNVTTVQTLSCTKLKTVLLVGASLFFLFIVFLSWYKNSKTENKPPVHEYPKSSVHM